MKVSLELSEGDYFYGGGRDLFGKTVYAPGESLDLLFLTQSNLLPSIVSSLVF